MIKWRWTQRWSMRLVQGNGQEKILVTILLQETDSPVTAAVRVGEALCHIRFKGSCPFSGFHPFLVSQLFQGADCRNVLNLVAQLTASVRWTQSVKNMVADGATDFTECGPGAVLQGLIKKIDGTVSAHGIA